MRNAVSDDLTTTSTIFRYKYGALLARIDGNNNYYYADIVRMLEEIP